ncbi:MAG: GrpB family protein [Bacteroides sp.]|nr:GrpB family protein [Bacteroides sp.]
MKDLKDMTLEELWQLFPITLSPHRKEWTEWAKREIASLEKLLTVFDPIVSHIGSTAIPGIMAKPIVDILVEVPPNTDKPSLKILMETNGYICTNESADRISFNKGYTAQGYAERVFHIHFHHYGDHDEILFRDYLISHPEVAHDYEILKQSLLPRYRNLRDAYTDAKTEFIRRVTNLAR